MKRVLVLGVGSYIGTCFRSYVENMGNGRFEVDAASLRGEAFEHEDWSGYDAVLNVTGKAHADISAVSEEEQAEYYHVNRDLAVKAYRKAVSDGVGQYIYLSSIIVYGDSGNSRRARMITGETAPSPDNFYGDSKWQAEQELGRESLSCGMRLAILRPPMIYGAGCKGNYQSLSRFAEKLPFFPDYRNERSMLYIGNLCEYLCCLIESGQGGVFFPQNREYVSTADMVCAIASTKGRRVRKLKALAPAVAIGKHMPGKVGRLIRKAFGTLTYEKGLGIQPEGYREKYGLRESVQETEGGEGT